MSKLHLGVPDLEADGFAIVGPRFGRTPRLFKGGGKGGGGGSVSTPAPAVVAPPAPTPTFDTITASKRRLNAEAVGAGRSSLRIDRTVNTYGSSGGTGLNIPQ